MDDKELNLGHLAEEFAKLLVDVPGPESAEETINLEEGERREVTILFLDLVGYTRLAEQLDPEQLKFVISNTLQVFTNQIKKCGGTVEKYVGDAIMALFGRAEAHEDDSRRAVVAAKSILERIDDVNSILSQKGISIKARIGINRGLIVTGILGGHDTVTGEAINIAQRLEANAPENGILIEEGVYNDCKKYYHCESLPPLYVKNKTEPLSVYMLQDEIPQGERRRHEMTGPFVGRVGEIATLRSSWQYAGQGHMSTVQIVGGAGVGKRAVLHAFVDALRKDGIEPNPILVRSDSFGMQPYHALTGMVRDYLDSTSVSMNDISQATIEETEDLLPNYRIYLDDLLGVTLSKSDQSTLEQMEPRARQAETFVAVKRFLTTAATRERRQGTGPLIIAFDHLEWITHASRDAIAQIMRTLPADLPILWVFMARHREDMAWLPAQASSTSLTLAPLPLDATMQLLKARLEARGVTDAFCQEIYNRTGGNPFFIEEVLTVIGEMPDLSSFSLSEQVPGSIKTLMLSRLDRFPRQLNFVLQVGAVAGPEFSVQLLQHVLERVQSTYDVSQSIAELVDDHMIKQDGESITIAQPMLAEVAYSTILHANRKKIHGLVAQWVEELRRDSLEAYAPYLANQWEYAENYEKAIHYCLQAGRAARTRFAYRDAASYFERALAFHARSPSAMDSDAAVDIHLVMVDLSEALGEGEMWKKHFQAGLSMSQPGSLPHCRLRLREIEHENRYGDRTKAPERLRAFLESPDVQSHHEVQMRALLVGSALAQERGEDDSDFIQAAEVIRQHVKNPDLLYLLDNNVFNHYKNADELKKAEEYFKRVLEAAPHNPYNAHVGYLLFCSYMWDRGVDFEAIVERAEMANKYFREVGWARGVGWAAFYRGAAFWRLGKFAEASAEYTAGIQEMERVRDHFMAERLQLLQAATLLFQGDNVQYQISKKALIEATQSQSDNEQLALRREFAMFEAQGLTERHALTKAYDELIATEAAPIAKVQCDEFNITMALVAAHLGRIDEAVRRADQVRDHIRENDKLWLMGMLARVDGLIASAQNDNAAFQRAFGESVLHFGTLNAMYDQHLSYCAWWRALREHQMEKTPEGVKVEKLLKNYQAREVRR